MNKIFSFSEFSKSKRVNESTMGQMTLKREEFDVIVDPQEEGGEGDFPGGGGGPVEINTGVTEGPGEKPLPKSTNPKKTPGKLPGLPNDKPGDQDGGKTPPPSLPNVGDRVILSDGRETTIKRVLPNGDIEV
jgi:hypothetical protein